MLLGGDESVGVRDAVCDERDAVVVDAHLTVALRPGPVGNPLHRVPIGTSSHSAEAIQLGMPWSTSQVYESVGGGLDTLPHRGSNLKVRIPGLGAMFI